jgi:hypothetical protein
MRNYRVEEPGQQRRRGGCETAQKQADRPVGQATKQLLEAQLLAGAAELERAG